MRDLDTVLAALRRRGAVLVNVGHGRDEENRRRAAAFVEAWDGEVGAVVSWPAEAASWLRPARRFVAGAPDAWLVADTASGWAGMADRLAAFPSWDPARTITLPGPVAPRGSVRRRPRVDEGITA